MLQATVDVPVAVILRVTAGAGSTGLLTISF
jgi:hypothetical protein